MIWLDPIDLQNLINNFTLEMVPACPDLTYNEIEEEIYKMVNNVKKLQKEKEELNK